MFSKRGRPSGSRQRARAAQTARWVSSKDGAQALETFKAENRSSLAEDRDGRLVFLARNAWDLDNTAKRFPAIAFRDTCELVS